MKAGLKISLASCALLLATGMATAKADATPDPMDDLFFLHQVSVLESMGYRDVHAMSSPDPRVTAFDAQGSEVVVSFNVDQGTVRRIDFVHFADR